MNSISHTAVALRLFGDELDPDEVTRLLGHEPSFCEIKGQSGARTGSWYLKADNEAAFTLEGQIENILSKLTRDMSVWKHLSESFCCEIFCGIFLRSINEFGNFGNDIVFIIKNRGLKISTLAQVS